MRDEAPIPDPLVLQLKHFVVDSLGLRDIRADEITDDEPLLGGKVALDPLDAVELATRLEERSGIAIRSQKEIHDAFANVVSLAAYIRSHAPANAAVQPPLLPLELPIRW